MSCFRVFGLLVVFCKCLTFLLAYFGKADDVMTTRRMHKPRYGFAIWGLAVIVRAALLGPYVMFISLALVCCLALLFLFVVFLNLRCVYIYIFFLCSTSIEGGGHARNELKGGVVAEPTARRGRQTHYQEKRTCTDMAQGHATARSTTRVPPNYTLKAPI